MISRITRRSMTSFTRRPGPLPLPPKEQKEFENLVANPLMEKKNNNSTKNSDSVTTKTADANHPDFVERQPLPEFEGDRNPITGEIGGPKMDPLVHGDWSFGGRVTDF